MAIDTPRTVLTVPASPRQPKQKHHVGMGRLEHGMGLTSLSGSKANEPVDKTSPRPLHESAASRLTVHLKQVSRERKRTRTRTRTRTQDSSRQPPLVPPLKLRASHLAPATSEAQEQVAKSSQQRFDAEGSNEAGLNEEAPSLVASDNLPQPRCDASSPLARSEQPSIETSRQNIAVPDGRTAAELKNAVPHRPDFTDKKKQVAMAGWGGGLIVEGTVAAGATVAGLALSVTALAAWAGIASLGAWFGQLYDSFETTGSHKLSKARYQEGLKLRKNAIDSREALARALFHEGKLEEGKACLDAARQMVVMMDEFLQGHEGYLAPGEAELLAQRRALELRYNDELIEKIKLGPVERLDPSSRKCQQYKQHEEEIEKLKGWIELMPDGKSARGEALHELKIQRGDLTAELTRLEARNAAGAQAVENELERVQANIELLEKINRQKQWPSLLRNSKHLGPRQVKRQRDADLSFIRLPPDIAATLITFVGVPLGVASIVLVGPIVTLLLSPFWLRSAKLDTDDSHRDGLKADERLKQIVIKLALGRAMLAHFEGLPPGQQHDAQTLLGKRIAHNLMSAALREYKQAMRDKKLAEKKELKGLGLRYAAIPAVTTLAGIAIVGSIILGTGTMGIGFGVAAAATAVGVGAYYVYQSKLKKKGKTDKHEGKRRQAAALFVKQRVPDLRPLYTGDHETVQALIAQLQIKAPDGLKPYLTVNALLNHNEHLMSLLLSEEYAKAPSNPAAPLDVDSASFAVQMAKPLGLEDERNNFLLHNDRLLENPAHKEKVALNTLASLFGAKVYEADRLPDHEPDQATDRQLTEAVKALDHLSASPAHADLLRLIAQKGGSLEGIEQWTRQDPANARFMQKAVADLRAAWAGENFPFERLAQLQDRLEQQDTLPSPEDANLMGPEGLEPARHLTAPSPASRSLLRVLVEWKNPALEGTQDAKAVGTTPPVGVPQFEDAIRDFGLTYTSQLQQKRRDKGHMLLGGRLRTPKQWLRYFDKNPLKKNIVISKLISTWRDTLRNDQGQIEVPERFASEDDYLFQVMRDTITQHASLSDSVAEHAALEPSEMLDTLRERFNCSRDLAGLCLQHLTERRQKAQQEQRAAAPEMKSQGSDSLWWDGFLTDPNGLPAPRYAAAIPVK